MALSNGGTVRIAIIGGVERSESHYEAIAERYGHSVAFHSGHMNGRGSSGLEDLVRGAGLLIVVTDINSHGAVLAARRAARRYAIPLVLHRRFSPAKLAAIVAGIKVEAGHARRGRTPGDVAAPPSRRCA
jgi:hypothetical protein